MLHVQAASGEDAVILSNSGTSAYAIWFVTTENVVYKDFAVTSAWTGNSAVVTYQGYEVDNVAITGSGAEYGLWYSPTPATDLYVHDCSFSTLGTAILHAARVENNMFDTCTYCLYVVGTAPATHQNVRIVVGNVFDSCTNIIRPNFARDVPLVRSGDTITFVNNTCYNGTTVFIVGSGSDAVRFRSFNNIFHTYTTVYDYSGATNAFLDFVVADYNTYYDCTNVAELGGSTYNMAEWQALTDDCGRSPDANSVTTDPGLTSPATPDFSLTAASNSRHAGVGSYALVQAGINEVAFDKWHPDKGAWSSGPGPNVAYAG
jgi:hypothetical protein